MFFFFNDTATTEIYTLSLHDALPICRTSHRLHDVPAHRVARDVPLAAAGDRLHGAAVPLSAETQDRKSTRLNSSHANISYAVFCLKKKKRHYIKSNERIAQ